MTLVEDNDMIETLATDGTDQAFRVRILPGQTRRTYDLLDAHARYTRQKGTANRTIGNGLIAVGALLPAIGGGASKFGYVEWLYVCEFFGLLFIWAGYAFCVNRPPRSDLRTLETG